MKILVINSGSSSLKYQLLDMETEAALASGVVERIGDPMGGASHKSHPGTDREQKHSEQLPVPDHGAAMQIMIDKLTGKDLGVIASMEEVDAIGHRVVQGGELFAAPVRVTKKVIDDLWSIQSLAPVHHSANMTGIEVAWELFPNTPAVIVFDNEFHQTMPKKAFLYPLPMEFYTRLKIRRYGFHGTSHKYVSKAAARFLNKPLDQSNLITVHLGNGCSMAAIRNGKCVDTTMGLTPLAGLMMGTRSGDIDPSIHAYLADNTDLDPREVDTLLNKKSGMFGICGLSDMRDVHAAREKGDENAQLAFDMFAYRVKKTLGAYAAILGSVDAVVFTAGIGENDDAVRAAACDGLSLLGISVDPELNATRSPGIRAIHTSGSAVSVLVIPTNEELEIAQTTRAIVAG
ncbi:acetate kinase [Pseudodesulfovibrio tunisiensis]|uniref:acetate kinase n=1 Tax=Pseudodesulfovibrio tunisiensis TaxID=463192 RepID=UPI001FB2027B|nr:acetate kinase [Pseudodesulfovibrio tunisiensis]